MESNTSISFLESCQPFGPGEKFCGSHQSWSHRRRRRRKWMSLQLMLSNCCAVPFQCFYLFLLVRIAVDAAKSGADQLSGGGGEKVPQRFAMEPQDQTAVVGSRVSLPCRVMNKSGQLQWTKDDFGLGTHRNLSGFERYSMVGSDEEGDFSLDIFPVMLDDDAKYQCQVGPGRKGTPGIRSRFASLMVLVPPEPPKIVQGDFMVTTEDREIELECVSGGGRPAAEITWIDGLGNVLTDGIEYMKEALPDARRFTAKSILKLIPKKEHHNTTFTCQAQNTADRTYRSVKLKLEVKYAPKVDIEVLGGETSGGKILEGSDVRLHCHADANPPDVTFRWYVGKEMVLGDYSTELVILNISKKYHDVIVKCEARNAVGKSEESETLDISYGPTFRTLPASVEADLDAVVSLSCDIDGNPTPDIVWVHEESGRVMSTLANLTLTVTHATTGRYFCQGSVLGFPEVEAKASVFLKGPPSIGSPRQQFGTVGDTGQLECEAFSVPVAKHIIWVHNGREINTSSPEHSELFSIVESRSQSQGTECVKSTLIIHDSRREHFGSYNCTVVNEYGVDSVEIDFVSKAENILLPVVIFGSLGGLTLLIIVIVVAMCFWGRTNKKKLPPADVIPKQHISDKDCKELDRRRTSNVSDLKIDRDNEFMETSLGPDGMTTQVNVTLGTATIANHHISTKLDGTPGLPGTTGSAMKISNDYRYSGDFTDSFCQLPAAVNNTKNSNGYVPYVDYSRDYSPPATAHLMQQFRTSTSSSNINNSSAGIGGHHQNHISAMTLGRHHRKASELRQDNGLPSIQGSLSSLPNGIPKQPLLQGHLTIDHRYGGGTTYGSSTFLRGLTTASSSLPPPATANPAATPAPPPYIAATRSSLAAAFGPSAGTGSTTIGSGSSPGTTTAAGSTSPSSIQSGSLSLSHSSQHSQQQQQQLPSAGPTSGSIGSNNGGSQQQQQQPGSPSAGQFILPTSGSIKQQGALATHV
ncbi:irregular chiasm C-roughest protein-like isoform X1 [Culex pipiens pallens]|nr:irregular chiasm C-roughest protein-like isoform X1 [Culex pipiens pallens]XP_052562385.1 irregular chiasm C-roughest protein-like isoform X1 [Culex pipiens pallens]XP_052562388.1 irregular chiasm C-roughest protein-like isoform X1 [Culex pipiens pallens]